MEIVNALCLQLFSRHGKTWIVDAVFFKWKGYGHKMLAWLVRTMMVKDYVAFYGGVMIKFVWLSNQQFEEISIYSWRCFLGAIGPKNGNPVIILEHPPCLYSR